MPNVPAAIKGTRAAPKALRSSMETLIVTPEQVNQWRVPPFQRPVRINDKVQAIAEEMKCNACSITGIITLGRITGDSAYYIVDGQHRIEAFRISGLPEIIADIRVVTFDTMADMADEFVTLNTAIVRMRPDDILRGVTPTLPNIQRVMHDCPFIGYDNVRRGGSGSAIVSLSSVLRCWDTSGKEIPSSTATGSINQVAALLDDENARNMIRFMTLAHQAWGRDPEYYRLWANCNLGLCMWLYRRLVLDTRRQGNYRVVVLKDDQFKKCLMALSTQGDYIDWLRGRLLNDRDRSPAYARIKSAFTRRLAEESPNKVVMPQPAWASR